MQTTFYDVRLTYEKYYGINNTIMDIITTNIRMKRDDLSQIKAIAAEADMSFNEYVNFVLRQGSLTQELGISLKKSSSPIWSLGKIATKKNQQTLTLSSEDQEIYE